MKHSFPGKFYHNIFAKRFDINSPLLAMVFFLSDTDAATLPENKKNSESRSVKHTVPPRCRKSLMQSSSKAEEPAGAIDVFPCP